MGRKRSYGLVPRRVRKYWWMMFESIKLINLEYFAQHGAVNSVLLRRIDMNRAFFKGFISRPIKRLNLGMFISMIESCSIWNGDLMKFTRDNITRTVQAETQLDNFLRLNPEISRQVGQVDKFSAKFFISSEVKALAVFGRNLQSIKQLEIQKSSFLEKVAGLLHECKSELQTLDNFSRASPLAATPDYSDFVSSAFFSLEQKLDECSAKLTIFNNICREQKPILKQLTALAIMPVPVKVPGRMSLSPA